MDTGFHGYLTLMVSPPCPQIQPAADCVELYSLWGKKSTQTWTCMVQTHVV